MPPIKRGMIVTQYLPTTKVVLSTPRSYLSFPLVVETSNGSSTYLGTSRLGKQWRCTLALAVDKMGRGTAYLVLT